MDNEKDIQKRIFEIRILEEQIKQLENQVAALDKEICDIQDTQTDLDEIGKIRQKEILVPLGRNIFINSKVDSGEKVLVDIGAKIIVKKDINGAKKLLEKQKERFAEARIRVNEEVDRIISHIDKVDREIQNMQK